MVWEELESRYTNYGKKTIPPVNPAFSERIGTKINLKVQQSLPRHCGWYISLELLLLPFFLLFPRAREFKGLSFLKHSPALPGVHLLFLQSILLFCGINSRSLLKGHLNIGFRLNWKYKACLGFLSLNLKLLYLSIYLLFFFYLYKSLNRMFKLWAGFDFSLLLICMPFGARQITPILGWLPFFFLQWNSCLVHLEMRTLGAQWTVKVEGNKTWTMMGNSWGTDPL